MTDRVLAVLVTRGDVDLAPILATIRWAGIEALVYDNSKRPDLRVFGRYALLESIDADLVYVQDDDCLTDPRAIIAAAKPGAITCNMPMEFRPFYQDDIALVGFGAVFEPRVALAAIAEYDKMFPRDDLFLGECDRVVTGLSPLNLIDVPKENMDYASGAGRMWLRPDHHLKTLHICRRVYSIRAARRAANGESI